MNENAKAPEFMNVTDIAKLFGVNRVTVHDWIAAGKFPGAFKAGKSATSAYLIPLPEVEAYKKERDQLAG